MQRRGKQLVGTGWGSGCLEDTCQVAMNSKFAQIPNKSGNKITVY